MRHAILSQNRNKGIHLLVPVRCYKNWACLVPSSSFVSELVSKICLQLHRKNCELQSWLEKKDLHLQGNLFGINHMSDSNFLRCSCLHGVPAKQETERKDLKGTRWTIFFLSGCCCWVGCISDCLAVQSVRMKFISYPSIFSTFWVHIYIC